MEKYFPRSTTAAVRGVSAIVIIFCHLDRTMIARIANPLPLFKNYATLAVGIFFFYTGYNLIAAYVSMGGEYSRTHFLFPDIYQKRFCICACISHQRMRGLFSARHAHNAHLKVFKKEQHSSRMRESFAEICEIRA